MSYVNASWRDNQGHFYRDGIADCFTIYYAFTTVQQYIQEIAKLM